MTRPATRMGEELQPLDTSPAWLHIAIARLGPFSVRASVPQGAHLVPDGDERHWRQTWVWFLEHGRQVTAVVDTYRDRQRVMLRAEGQQVCVEFTPGPVPDRVVTMLLRMVLPAAP